MNNRRKKMSIIWCLVAIAVMVSSPIQAQNTGQQMKGATEVPLDTDEQTGVTRAVVIGISN
ncbi:MAG: hypothetical protein IIA45_15950 [Bacteroidetes bacterium]|nr:hypothetical protein [Bacteroidota bacterium]